MSKEILNTDLEKKFKTYFSPWVVSLIISVTAFVLAFFIKRVKDIVSSSTLVQLWTPLLLALGVCLWFCIKRILRFKGLKPEKRHKNGYILIFFLMRGSVALILLATGGVLFLPSPKNHPAQIACTAILNDSLLYHHKLTDNERGYIIKNSDSNEVTTLNCDAYINLKSEVKKRILLQCDAEGIYKCGSKIQFYLDNGEPGRAVISELKNNHFVFINELVYKGENEKYYYKVSICLSRDRYNAVDSLIEVALAKGCIRRIVDTIVFIPLQNQSAVTVSFTDIVKSFCINCPGNTIVKEILKQCGGDAGCDSVYFVSGNYKLSFASELILRGFYDELRKKRAYNLYVDFYGYTDPARVRGAIPYADGGRVAERNQLLPDNKIISQPLIGIANNDQLSFARAYSCYNYMLSLQEKNSSNIIFRYTGGGVSNNSIENYKQRSVKIIITKK
jgi:hypothetical protein